MARWPKLKNFDGRRIARKVRYQRRGDGTVTALLALPQEWLAGAEYVFIELHPDRLILLPFDPVRHRRALLKAKGGASDGSQGKKPGD